MSFTTQPDDSAPAPETASMVRTTPLLVMVQETRFWLTANEMTKLSEVFRNLFMHTPEMGAAREGTVDNPLKLQGIKLADFEPLVRWMRFGAHPPNNRQYTVENLLGMLHLADQWDMPQAESFCYSGLAALGGDPFFMLKVVTGYRKWGRVRALVEEAVRIPSLHWSWNDPAIFIPIMKLRIRLDEVKRSTTTIPQIVPQHEECTAHKTCTLKWRNDWRIHIVERVFQPVNPLPLSECYDAMLANSPSPNTCRRLALVALRFSNDFDIEDDLYHEYTTELISNFH